MQRIWFNYPPTEDEVLKSSKSQQGSPDRIKDEELRRLLENLPDEDMGRYKM